MKKIISIVLIMLVLCVNSIGAFAQDNTTDSDTGKSVHIGGVVQSIENLPENFTYVTGDEPADSEAWEMFGSYEEGMSLLEDGMCLVGMFDSENLFYMMTASDHESQLIFDLAAYTEEEVLEYFVSWEVDETDYVFSGFYESGGARYCIFDLLIESMYCQAYCTIYNGETIMLSYLSKDALNEEDKEVYKSFVDNLVLSERIVIDASEYRLQECFYGQVEEIAEAYGLESGKISVDAYPIHSLVLPENFYGFTVKTDPGALLWEDYGGYEAGIQLFEEEHVLLHAVDKYDRCSVSVLILGTTKEEKEVFKAVYDLSAYTEEEVLEHYVKHGIESEEDLVDFVGFREIGGARYCVFEYESEAMLSYDTIYNGEYIKIIGRSMTGVIDEDLEEALKALVDSIELSEKIVLSKKEYKLVPESFVEQALGEPKLILSFLVLIVGIVGWVAKQIRMLSGSSNPDGGLNVSDYLSTQAPQPPQPMEESEEETKTEAPEEQKDEEKI